MPMNTTLVSNRCSRWRSRLACRNWSTISASVRFRSNPERPVAQKLHPIGHPTCELTQIVVRGRVAPKTSGGPARRGREAHRLGQGRHGSPPLRRLRKPAGRALKKRPGSPEILPATGTIGSSPIVGISPPTRGVFVTQRERNSNRGSFHLHRAKDKCWKSHNDLPCRMSSPSLGATLRTHAG